MAKRLTDEDLTIGHAALCAWLAALGYIDKSAPKADIMKVYAKVKKAEEAGDVRIPEEGHYELTRSAYERFAAANAAQPRARTA
ncbi:MAG: hypothetical protein K0Q60_2606 [Microvirga sp.]|jgi:hypothetical protein|nr:hypothetical protein [Microvirga sp.]